MMLEDILSLSHLRVVGDDNCHEVQGNEYETWSMVVLHEGKCRMGNYDRDGNPGDKNEDFKSTSSGLPFMADFKKAEPDN